MKKTILAACLAVIAAAALAAQPAGKLLYVYDEANDSSKPYIERFRKAFADGGIAFDEATAAEAAKKDLSAYRVLVIHGMVMAFNGMSPVRDWLKTGPDLKDKEVRLFVTANRWFVDKLRGQLAALLEKDGATTVDAVSMATKTMGDAAKVGAVEAFVARLR
jgi:hypothetical protein